MFRTTAGFVFSAALAAASLVHASTRGGVWEPKTVLVELAAQTSRDGGPPFHARSRLLVAELPSPWRALFGDAGATEIEPLFPDFDPLPSARWPARGSASGAPPRVPHDLSLWLRVRLADDRVEAATRTLAASPLVATSEPNYFRCSDALPPVDGPVPSIPGGQRTSGARAEAWPNDPLWTPHEWGLDNWGQYGGIPGFDLNALHAWQSYGTSHANARVAILDSGIDPDHPDLPLVELGVNTTGSGPPIDDDAETWQGTACAGIVAMSGNNAIGGAGVAWSLIPVSCKIRSGATPPTAADIAQAVDWCRLHDVPIMNLGYSSSAPSMLEKQSLRNARAAGLVTVVSSGNDNTGSARYPAAYAHHVVTVGAFFASGDRWVDSHLCGLEQSPLGSCFGSWLDLTAPGGRGIATTRHHAAGGGYYDLDIQAGSSCFDETLDWSTVDGFGGTAAAAAFASGAIGSVLAANPELYPEDAQEIVIRTAVDHQLPVRGWDSEYGWGRPDLEEALRLASPPYKSWHATTYVGNAVYDGSGLALFVDADGLADGQYGFLRYRVEATIPVNETFVGTPMGWGRVEGTIGWSRIENGTTYVATDEDAGSCKVVALSTTSITVRTYVYDLFRMDGSYIGTYPHAGITAMSFTVLGPGQLLDVPALDPATAASLRAAPNPAAGAVRISLGTDTAPGSGAAVHIYDAGGRDIATLPFERGGDATWNLRDRSGAVVAPGVYFAKADAPELRVRAVRILVTR